MVKVNKVLAREGDKGNARQEQAQYGQLWGAAEGQAYYNQLKDRFKVKMLAAKPASATAPGNNP